LIYHLGLEGLGSLSLDDVEDTDSHTYGIEGDITLHGTSAELGGNFHIRIIDHPDIVTSIRGNHHDLFSENEGKTAFLGVNLPDGHVWRIKDVLSQSINAHAQTTMVDNGFEPSNPPDPSYLFRLQNKVQSVGDSGAAANVWALQKVGVGSGVSGGGKWGFDVYFENTDAGSADEEWTCESPFADDHNRLVSLMTLKITDESLTRQLAEQSKTYDQRFAETFALPAEFSSPSYTKFAQSITSNLIGGIGYFYGDSIIDRSFKQPYDEDGTDDDDDDEYAYTGPKGPTREPPRELLTATPSRSFFPRGFYWDEGFHLPIIADWDNDLSLEILKSWIDLIDENGWVAREQILGDEARSKVPTEFQTQYPSYANPPTLPMAVTGYIRRLKATERKRAEGGAEGLLEAQLGLGQLPLGEPATSPALVTAHLDSPSLASSYLLSIYPSLRRHYQWFRRTQRGQLKEWGRRATSRVEAYRWRGRTEHHVLTSGLDDYPRAEKPHVGELHVDLMSWMGFFARTMREVAEYLDEEDDAVEYRRHERGILANLEGECAGIYLNRSALLLLTRVYLNRFALE
jgi:mannosyl-oligosaccharide glucosidase